MDASQYKDYILTLLFVKYVSDKQKADPDSLIHVPAGGSFDDVAKLTIYVVDWSPDKLPLIGEGVGRAAAKLGVDPTKPITLLGVAALGEPDLLVEVEATAVLD